MQVSAVSLACAVGVLAITQRAPAFAGRCVWELARSPYWLLIVFLVAAFAAHDIRLLRARHRAERCDVVAQAKKPGRSRGHAPACRPGGRRR